MKATGIQIAQRDDAQAFDRLVGEQQDWLYNLAYRLTGDAQAASAAVEQTLAQACQDLTALQPGSARLWLARFAVRACWTELRRRGDLLVPGTPEAPDPASPDGGGPPGLDPQNCPVVEEEIQRCLDRLPLAERTVLVLVDVLGLGYAEAAQVTGKPLSTVSRRLAKARVHLDELLKAGA
jgi:RNA polymerase sigma-70 factor (ECF subfamily)